ncbi:unnamed protein product [Spodoptera littoralis]|uniref:CRAL-TRIO domain-containing protein n=1 Tax=Spodoptera littoralis TaxID=7109 RepID=A0A9P0N0N0_SPOLI|nr:unnamed protein product [Spodoptera littoralis]CAH1637279.1 unnamed protein product [Spodoptera littoralis]
MTQVSEKDVVAIKDWMAKDPTLPKNFEDIMIKKFLYSCNNSLERTKKCILTFCNTRTTMTEVFSNRDPLSPKLQTAFNNTSVATYSTDKDEILIHRLETTENFDFYDCLKSFTLQSDQWISLEREPLPENHIVIIDIKEITLMIVAKANVFFFQKFLLFLLEATPVHLIQVHVVNCPSFYEYMYGLVKGALPQNIRDITHFHTDHMGLHQYIDKKYLPIEYDGEAESMVEQTQFWVKKICENRSFYLDENLWKANINKKAHKNAAVDTSMSGSFRTLAID